MTFMLDDDDFYRLLSAAVERDASFGDESLLKTPLEEGRLYPTNNNSNNSNKKEDEPDDFTKAIRILRDSRRINLSFTNWFRRNRKSTSAPKAVAITPTILSGLCGYASKRRMQDGNKIQQQQQQRQQPQLPDAVTNNKPTTTSTSTTTGSNMNNKSKIVTVTSSDLLRYCQGRRSQAIQHLRRKRRRKHWMMFLTPCFLLLSVSVLMVKRMSRILDQMNNLNSADEWACGQIQLHQTQQLCHFLDTQSFQVLYDDGFFQPEITTTGVTPPSSPWTCNLPQQKDPAVRICNPSKYSMHLQLINETLSESEVKGLKPVSFQSGITRDELYAQETVVNQLVRQAIEDHSEQFPTAQNKAVLDVGCGFGASLYSVLPLMGQHSHPNQHHHSPARPRRRQAKPPMLHYLGFALGPLEVAHAKDLAKSYLKGTDEIVNSTFVFGNIAADQLPPELKVKQSYDAILAIESLSYAEEKKLKPLLHAMFGALRKGGILVLVDDIVLPKDPTDPSFQNSQVKVNLFRQALMRPSILTHDAWEDLFRATGFKMVEARELTLEFELLPDHIDVSLPRTESNIMFSYTLIRIVRFLQDSYQKLMLRSLMLLRFALSSRKGQPDLEKKLGAWLRMILLQHGATSTQRANSLRKGAYENADLSYNFYVVKR